MQQLQKNNPRIALVAGAILIAISVLVGVTVFIFMERHAEALMGKTLQLTLQDSMKVIQAEVDANLGKINTVATNHSLLEQMQAVYAGVSIGAARSGLTGASQNLLSSTGLKGIRLIDRDGRELTSVGAFTQQAELAVPLNAPGAAQLMWDGKLLLHSVLDMKKDGRIIGKVIAETLLPESTEVFKNSNRLGETEDLFLCSAFGLQMQCFPTTLSPKIMTLEQRTPQGLSLPLPMSHALAGGTGFMSALDYRGQKVVAAYAPVGDLGLGLVVKIDSAELHAPMRTQLAYLIALLVGMLGIALVLLRWRLNPLVTELVYSEAEAVQLADARTQEIAAHRQIEAELLRFKHVLDNTQDMIFMLVPNTFRFVYLNKGAISSIGYGPEEYFQMICCQIAPLLSKSTPKFKRGLASLLSGEKSSLHFDTLCRRKDGTDFPVDIFLQMMSQTDGNHLLVAIVRDITERKKNEQMKSDFISVMYKKNSEAVTVADSNGTILSVNPAFTKITGYTQEEVVGRNSSVLSSGHHEQPFYEAMWSEINTVGHWGGEIWNRRKNGEVYLQWTTINAIFHDDGSIYRYVALFSDISQKRQAKVERDALRHANQMKSEFLANMSHELRTPLNAIIGFSEAFKEGLLGDITEQQSKYIGHVFDSGKYLLSLINDILDLSKVEAGKMVLDLEPVEISSLLENSLAIIKEKAMAHHIRLELKVEAGIDLIQADARKFKQIVYNLLSNAVKFSNENGVVALHARCVPRAAISQLTGPWPRRGFPLADSGFTEFLEICISDNGIGISSAGMEKLFQPFSQIDSGLARKFEGTGLGLVMIKNLVELHGGTLALESAEGEGSRFTIWLPLRLTPEPDSMFMPADSIGMEGPAKETGAPAPYEKAD